MGAYGTFIYNSLSFSQVPAFLYGWEEVLSSHTPAVVLVGFDLALSLSPNSYFSSLSNFIPQNTSTKINNSGVIKIS